MAVRGQQQSWSKNGAKESTIQDWLQRHRRPTVVAVVVVAIVFAAAMVYAYREGQRALSAEPPLVRAPSGPYRFKPDDPGGMTVPDRDKLVYNRVSGEGEDAPVQLRPGPELPVDRPEPEVVAPALDTKPEPTAEEEKAPVNVPVNVIAAKVAPPMPAAAEGVYVQLGALASQQAADAAWDRLSRRSPELKAVKRVVSPLKRADGVTLYRLRAGPLADKVAADKLCAALKAGGQGCFIVRP